MYTCEVCKDEDLYTIHYVWVGNKGIELQMCAGCASRYDAEEEGKANAMRMDIEEEHEQTRRP